MNKQFIVLGLIIIIFTNFLCGCTEMGIKDNEKVYNEFLGTWIGNMEFSIFNFRENMSNFNMTDKENISASNITKLEFTKDILYMTITTKNSTFTMPNSYTVEGNQLILSYKFTGEMPRGRPDFNEGERPPFDGERPFEEERPSRIRSYIFNFNEEYDILYLNRYQFKKSS